MKCEECGTEIVERKATPERPYRFDLSGIMDLFLVGIKIEYCPKCKSESPVIPRMAELHEVIAEHLIEKPGLLRGDELRFLRKFAGFPANRFAALLDVGASHLSRVENGKTKALSGSLDKLARALVAAARKEEHTKQILLGIADVEMKSRKKKSTFKLESNRWMPAA